MPQSWTPTRDEALRRLDEFLPRAGRDYAELRNYDFGPDDRSNVSQLSPYLRHRLLLEAEAVAATLARHGERAAEAFLREVCWRTYWKGWLELRPRVWDDYRDELDGSLRAIERQPRLRDRVEAVVSGRSGMACVDAWVGELVGAGYLHNHARMWFANLWIFTFDLPWTLGADFFLRHLLDGDPASNTLSWRWVAGLQTRGKTYRATAENVARYTNGRFHPEAIFAGAPEPLDGPEPPRPGRLTPRERAGAGRTGLLLTEEDLHPESWDLGPAEVVAVAALPASEDRSLLPTGPLPLAFARGAIADGLRRASGHLGVEPGSSPTVEPAAVAAWAAEHDLTQVVTAEAPVGPTADRLRGLDGELEHVGVRLVRLRRDWDDTLWPHATAGFFPFKEKLPRLWRGLGLDRHDFRKVEYSRDSDRGVMG